MTLLSAGPCMTSASSGGVRATARGCGLCSVREFHWKNQGSRQSHTISRLETSARLQAARMRCLRLQAERELCCTKETGAFYFGKTRIVLQPEANAQLLRPALTPGGGAGRGASQRRLVCGWVSCSRLWARDRPLIQPGLCCNKGRSYLGHTGVLLHLSTVDPVLRHRPQSPPNGNTGPPAPPLSTLHSRTCAGSPTSPSVLRAGEICPPGPGHDSPSWSFPTAPRRVTEGPCVPCGAGMGGSSHRCWLRCSGVHTHWASISLGRSL